MLFILTSLYANVIVKNFEDDQTYHSGRYTIEVLHNSAYVGDMYEDFYFHLTVRPVYGGFNLTFRARKSAIDFNILTDEIEITYRKDNDDIKKFENVIIQLKGNDIDDISFDEVREMGSVVTIMRIRFL